MRVLSIFLFLPVFLVSCGPDRDAETIEYVEIRGETMGTTYLVKHQKVTAVDYRDSIADLLEEVNMALSTYIPESVISTFNRNGVVRFETDRDGIEEDELATHFMRNLYQSMDVWEKSKGAFDPTVSPLVNAWGFGWEGKPPVAPDSSEIDSLLGVVGMEKVEVDRIDQTREVKATEPGVQLDFSALAKGYGVDVIGDYLEARGLYDYFIEIGGEVRIRGLSPRGDHWLIGINTPDQSAAISDIVTRVSIPNGSMATSGNYRNFYEINGRRVWHTIDPETGYPKENNLLSASIVTSRCMYADALATAAMVMGYPGCQEFIDGLEDTEGYFIYRESGGETKTSYTAGFIQYLVDNATESQ